MKKLNEKKFIERSIKIHGDKYDYSEVKYINENTEVILKCKQHGIFLQKPKGHMKGDGCKKCGIDLAARKRLKNIDLDIEKAKLIHDNKYDYSLIEYKGQKNPVKIICPQHGVFEQILSNHILNKAGCPFCIMKMPISAEEILKLNAHDKIENCSYNDKIKLNLYLYRCKEVHGDKYKYDFSNFINYNTPIKIFCQEHGWFTRCLNNHLEQSGCPVCFGPSKGEYKIKQFLDFHQIKYVQQKTFDFLRNPRTNRKFFFDFFLPEYNLLIEYDGEQHYPKEKKRKSSIWNIKDLLYRDECKNQQCFLNKIPLLRIKYTDFQNIEKKLTDALNIYCI